MLLSKSELKIYKYLLNGDVKTAKIIANEFDILVEATHRSLKSLRSKGLIASFGKYPTYFQALPMELGALAISQRFQKNLKAGDKPLPLRVITHRQKYHEVGEENFKRATKEVLVIASGTGDLSQDFTKTMFDATRKGVDYRIICLTFGKPNSELLENWRKNGFKIKYRKGKGFNLVIYDRKMVQMGIRLTESFKEKYGLIIRNESLSEFLGEFFDFLWKSSKEI